MKIVDLELFLLDSAGNSADSPERTLLVRLITTDGEAGWGEARTNWRAAEIVPRREALLPILAGRYVADIEELLEIPALERSPLCAAVEMACWDLVARRAGQPLCRLWGGDYRPRVPLAVRLPSAPTESTAQLARDLVERGLHQHVLTATGDPVADLATVAAVREATAGRVQLRFDGACRFQADQAVEMCRSLERSGLEFLLDPLQTELDGLAALARQTSVPLAASMGIRSPADVMALARSGAAPHVVIDIVAVGGLGPARKCAVVAAAAGLRASLRGGDGLGVALAGMLQLAAATPNLGLAHECAAVQLREDILRDRPGLIDGAMSVPHAPGLGVEVDRARLDKYQVT